MLLMAGFFLKWCLAMTARAFVIARYEAIQKKKHAGLLRSSQ
jgi:hypothetical protein